eukprot:GFUD01035022.1.p1 GENE.GFUD01035022.1~~GFUD01035022.1.p1  ORF type:complete len:196 (+),score=72.92 GFUD01035022.1:81-668(+)
MPVKSDRTMEGSKVQLKLIVAVCAENGIGKDNNLPWRIKSELSYFAKMTKTVGNFSKQNAVLMGRKTWESIPARIRPLKNRINIVLTRQDKSKISEDENVLVCDSLENALEVVDGMNEQIETCWVIGGSSVYEEAMKNPRMERIYLTNIMKDYDCDTFFPSISDDNWEQVEEKMVPKEVQEEEGVKFEYRVYSRK